MNGTLHLEERGWCEKALAGSLAAGLASRVRDHLRGCDECRTFYDRGTAVLRALEGPTAGTRVLGPIERDLVEGWILDEASATKPSHARRGFQLLAAVAGLVCVALILIRAKQPRTPGVTRTTPANQAPAALVHDGSPSEALHEIARTHGIAAGPVQRTQGLGKKTPDPEDLGGLGETNVFAADFESGALGSAWVAGELAPPPPSEDRHNRFALKGVRYHGNVNFNLGARYEDPDGIATMGPDLWIEFDHWVGEGLDTAYVELAFHCEGVESDFVARMPDVPRGRWVHAIVRLADARPYKDRSRLPPDGAMITRMKWRTNFQADDVFFVDRIRLFRR